MVGILVSFWDGLFAGAMLVSGKVDHSGGIYFLWKVSEQEWSRTKCTGEIQIVFVQTLYQTRTDCRRLREDLSSPLEVSLSLCSIHHLGPGTHDMEWFWANSWIFQHVFLAHPTGCATGCEDFPDSSQDNRRGGGTGEKTLSEWLLAEQPARVKPNFLLLSDCQPQRGFARGHGKHYALWRHTETHSQRWNSQHSIISPENHAI